MDSLNSILAKLTVVFNFGLRQKNERNIHPRTRNNSSELPSRRVSHKITRVGSFHSLFYRALKLGTTRSLIPLRPQIYG